MKLVEGNTPWNGFTMDHSSSSSPLQDKASSDIVVIGGGISGAITSYVLSAQGINTILLEKETIGSGSSSANTGLLQFMNDDPLTELIQTFGERIGVGFYKLCEKAVDRLSDIADHLSLDTEFRRRSSLYYASTKEDSAKIQMEYDALNRHGFKVEYWDQKRIQASFPFSKPAAIYSRHDAEVNPYKMVQALIKDAIPHGLRVYEHSPVEHVDYTDTGVVVRTKSGIVKASTIIWTTGYDTQEWKPDALASLYSTHAIMTEPIQDLSSWHENALLWETKRPYLYMRTTLDQRIIAGGLDEPLSGGGLSGEKIAINSQKLLQNIQDLFPSLDEISISNAWSGVFATSKDGMPLIGRHPDYPHCLFIEGYGGNGTVYSMIAADLIAKEVTGKTPEELDWFSFRRSLQTNASAT